MSHTGTPGLRQVVEHFLSKYGSTAPMYKKQQAALGLLLEFLGDLPVSALRQIDIENYLALLCWLPPRWSDEVWRAGISAAKLTEREHTVTLSPKTFEYSYMAPIRPFLAEERRLFGDCGFPERLTVEGISTRGIRRRAPVSSGRSARRN